MSARDIVIVGAGPAGMAAAATLSELGLRATVLDDNPRCGGQIYKQSAWNESGGAVADAASGPGATAVSAVRSSAACDATTDAPRTRELTPPARREEWSDSQDRGEQLRARFERAAANLEIVPRASVWGLFPPRTLAVSRDEGWELLEAGQLVLACGAYELVSPFPGWTLPGAFTPGGAQTLVKSQRVRPGERVFLGGSGPFLLVVAHTLLAAGVEVVGVAETARRRDIARRLPGLLADWRLLAQGRRYLSELRRAGVPIHWGHVVTAAKGDRRVAEVVFAPCDADGRPDRHRERRVAADTLCVGYGFVPRTELARLAGCRTIYDELVGGWAPEVDPALETSVEDVWVAGDCGGVAGAIAAELSGELVGLNVARRLGAIDANAWQRRAGKLNAELARVRRFGRALSRAYRPPQGLSALAQPDTVVCRCEEVTREEVEDAIRHGGLSGRTLKVMTRLGMGPCQGRMCWPAAARLIAEKTGRLPAEIEPLGVRPPTVPVCLGDLLHVAGEEFAAPSTAPHGSSN